MPFHIINNVKGVKFLIRKKTEYDAHHKIGFLSFLILIICHYDSLNYCEKLVF